MNRRIDPSDLPQREGWGDWEPYRGDPSQGYQCFQTGGHYGVLGGEAIQNATPEGEPGPPVFMVIYKVDGQPVNPYHHPTAAEAMEHADKMQVTPS